MLFSNTNIYNQKCPLCFNSWHPKRKAAILFYSIHHSINEKWLHKHLLDTSSVLEVCFCARKTWPRLGHCTVLMELIIPFRPGFFPRCHEGLGWVTVVRAVLCMAGGLASIYQLPVATPAIVTGKTISSCQMSPVGHWSRDNLTYKSTMKSVLREEVGGAEGM